MEESILGKQNVMMVYNNIVSVNNLYLKNEMEIGYQHYFVYVELFIKGFC
jgi:hypothetical protein